jgi:hypothetical protein
LREHRFEGEDGDRFGWVEEMGIYLVGVRREDRFIIL